MIQFREYLKIKNPNILLRDIWYAMKRGNSYVGSSFYIGDIFCVNLLILLRHKGSICTPSLAPALVIRGVRVMPSMYVMYGHILSFTLDKSTH